MILKKKIYYSNKKKKIRVIKKIFKSKKERYLLKDWRRWQSGFKNKFKSRYPKKFILKNKIKHYKYNLYNLNKKAFLEINKKKIRNNRKRFRNQNNHEKFLISNVKFKNLQNFLYLPVQQPYELIEEEDNKMYYLNWHRRRRMLKIINKPKLTRNARRRIRRKNYMQRPIKKIKKRFKIFFEKSLEIRTRKIKFKRLEKKHKKLKKFSNYVWVRKSLAKYNNYFTKKKQVFLRYIQIELKNNLKLLYRSKKQLLDYYYLNYMLNKIIKKFINTNFRNIRFELSDYEDTHKLKKNDIIFLTQEKKVRTEIINLKKKK